MVEIGPKTGTCGTPFVGADQELNWFINLCSLPKIGHVAMNQF